MIGKYIEEVDALGDIGTVNLDKVCKIISKSRRLTPETATLLYSAERQELAMYDCTCKFAGIEVYVSNSQCSYMTPLSPLPSSAPISSRSTCSSVAR